jgi:hypothetical protein
LRGDHGRDSLAGDWGLRVHGTRAHAAAMLGRR